MNSTAAPDDFSAQRSPIRVSGHRTARTARGPVSECSLGSIKSVVVKQISVQSRIGGCDRDRPTQRFAARPADTHVVLAVCDSGVPGSRWDTTRSPGGRPRQRSRRCHTGSRALGTETVGEDLIDSPRVVRATVVGFPDAEESWGPLARRRLRCQSTHVCEHRLDPIVGESFDQVNQLIATRDHEAKCR